MANVILYIDPISGNIERALHKRNIPSGALLVEENKLMENGEWGKFGLYGGSGDFKFKCPIENCSGCFDRVQDYEIHLSSSHELTPKYAKMFSRLKTKEFTLFNTMVEDISGAENGKDEDEDTDADVRNTYFSVEERRLVFETFNIDENIVPVRIDTVRELIENNQEFDHLYKKLLNDKNGDERKAMQTLRSCLRRRAERSPNIATVPELLRVSESNSATTSTRGNYFIS